MNNSSSRRLFCVIPFKHLVAVRRISSSENKPLNPFRKVVRRQGLIVDDGKVANRICLSVVGNGAVGQPSTLCLFTDRKSYMFNCGEGIGRVFRENDTKISDIWHIFVTHKAWKNMGGLPDLYLTLQTFNRKKLTLHGPPFIEEFFGVTASHHKNTRISKKPVENETYTDGTVEVQYVPIFGFTSVTSQLRSEIRSVNHNHQRRKSDVPDGSNVVVCYICKFLSKPRELSLDRCVEFGITPGPLLLELKNGNDITLPSGRKVLSEDVLEPELPNSEFLVVDCPSEHFLDSFVNEEKFKPYQMHSSAAFGLCAIVHFTPPHIFDSYKYQKWISRFPLDTLHLVLNSNNVIPHKVAVHQIQEMLHLLQPRIFKSLPKHSVEIEPGNSNGNIIQAREGLVLQLRPSMNLYLNDKNVVHLEPESFVQRAKEDPSFCESLSQLHSLLHHKSKKNGDADKYPEIVFLGTGSSYASAYRGCSCILVNVSNEQSVIFDCGDGSYQQLVQYFGYNEIKNVLKRISCVFISHHHTDHYLGLFELVKARKEAFYSCNQKYIPLVVTIPGLLFKIFSNFENLFGPIRSDVSIFRNSSLNVGLHESEKHLRNYWKDFELSTAPVCHCADSHGVILSSGNKWKIVYSGDCSPSQSLIDAGKDCTVLIHEASIEDELESQALAQRHSTVSQALDVAQQMNAQHTIVTHFSNRYVEVPLIKDCYQDYSVGIAFDNMSVSLSELSSLPLLIPTLRCLFSERLNLHQVNATGNAGFESVVLKALKS